MAYSEKVIEHYENPRNVGSFDKGDQSVGTGMVGAPACGDVMKLQIRVNDSGIIEDARFKTYGCGSAIASSSDRPRARSTYEGSRLAEVQAEPEDTAMSLIAMISDSPSTKLKLTLRLCGVRRSMSPLT